MTPSQIIRLIKAAASSWVDDYAPSMGAALSYYTLFSIAPLLLIVISVAGLVFGEDAARGEIFAQLSEFMGNEAAAAIQSLLRSVNQPAQSRLGTLIGVGLVLIGATTVFAELQNAMDRIWHAPERGKPTGIWNFLRTRLLSFGMILSIGFLLMVSLVMGAVLAALGRWWTPYFTGWELVAQALNLVIGFGFTLLAFAMIYKTMPRVKIDWRDVWIGATVTAVLFTIGKFLIGYYIGKSGVVSGFGAASSIVVVLLWVYYSAQIFLIGAEFTRAYAYMYGSRQGQFKEESGAS
jgi:membrane protein